MTTTVGPVRPTHWPEAFDLHATSRPHSRANKQSNASTRLKSQLKTFWQVFKRTMRCQTGAKTASGALDAAKHNSLVLGSTSHTTPLAHQGCLMEFPSGTAA